jgi:hypothetical protein
VSSLCHVICGGHVREVGWDRGAHQWVIRWMTTTNDKSIIICCCLQGCNNSSGLKWWCWEFVAFCGVGHSSLFVGGGAQCLSLFMCFVAVLSFCCLFIIVTVHCRHFSVVGCHIADGNMAPASCVKKKNGRGSSVCRLGCIDQKKT